MKSAFFSAVISQNSRFYRKRLAKFTFFLSPLVMFAFFSDSQTKFTFFCGPLAEYLFFHSFDAIRIIFRGFSTKFAFFRRPLIKFANVEIFVFALGFLSKFAFISQLSDEIRFFLMSYFDEFSTLFATL